MDYKTIEQRDTVFRAYFEGRNWDRNEEYKLKRTLVLNSSRLLPDYPYVIEDEWEAQPGRTDQGRGDLVFTDGAGYFAIVEVKWLDFSKSGSSERTKQTTKRRTVEEQAIRYAKAYAEILRREFSEVKWVEACTFTNEFDRPKSLDVIDIDQLAS